MHDDLFVHRGIVAIAKRRGERKRQTQWMHTKGQIPTFVENGHVCMTEGAHRRHVQKLEAEAEASYAIA